MIKLELGTVLGQVAACAANIHRDTIHIVERNNNFRLTSFGFEFFIFK